MDVSNREQRNTLRPDQTWDLFISYARSDDEAFARRLYESLQGAGLNVWWDKKSMESRGRTFLDEIQVAIAGAERVVLVLGPQAAKSDYVEKEWRYALGLCKVINPILRIGNPDDNPELIPEELRLLHRVDFRQDANYATALAELVGLLRTPPASLGHLQDVPSLPISFLPRHDHLKRIAAIVMPDINSTVVLSSAHQTSGLKGMGGIGKSVLAAAFARDCDTRRHFHDGIIWLNAGSEKLDNVGVASRLAVIGAAFDDSPDYYSKVETARLRLSRLLEDKTCLIIVDDIWPDSQDVGQMIRRVLGPHCRLLVTTREGELATALGAQLHEVDVLSAENAMQLLSDWVTPEGEAPAALPAEAEEVARKVANLPFALALCGAMVRDGISWTELLRQLNRADLRFIKRNLPDYPYSDLLLALDVGIKALEAENANDAKHYRELVVFPTDDTVPEDAVVSLWLHTNGLESADHARALLVRLRSKSLLRLDVGPEGRRSVALHDLSHDYLRAELTDLPGLHTTLLEAYQDMCSAGWETGPDDGYFFQRLSYHLHGAGRLEELRRLLLDPTWLRTKLAKTDALALIGDYKFLGDDANNFLFGQALPVLAPLTEANDLKALMLEDVLADRMIEFGKTNPEAVRQACQHLLYGCFDSQWDRLRRRPHAYRFAVTVANELEPYLNDVLKRASTHPDVNIRNAALYTAYMRYRSDPQASMEMLHYAVGKAWVGLLPNFAAMYSALTLSLILGMGFYDTPEGPQRRAEMIAAWLPVVNRLPSQRARWLRRITRPGLRQILQLVIRFVVFQIGETVDEKALFSIKDAQASIPVPTRARPHVQVMLEHYQHVWDRQRWEEFRIEDLHPHLEAVLLDDDPLIRKNIMVTLCFFASMLPWARRDPKATATMCNELFEAAKARRSDLMKEAPPTINTIVWTVGNSSKPDSLKDSEFILETYGKLFYEFEDLWQSRCIGLKSTYRLGAYGMYVGLYYLWRGDLDSAYRQRFMSLVVERSDRDVLHTLVTALGNSNVLVEMNVLPHSRSVWEKIAIQELRLFLETLQRMDVNPEDFEVSISNAFINLKMLDRDGVEDLLKEAKEPFVTRLMRQRIQAARRSPEVSMILGTVASWFATTATQDDDPMGRLALGKLFEHLVAGRSLADGLVDFLEYYLNQT